MFYFFLFVVVLALLTFWVTKPLSGKRSSKSGGYYGYQVAGRKASIILRPESDLTSYAVDFATRCLGVNKKEAIRQIKASLADGSGEVYLQNGLGEKYLLKAGGDHTVVAEMLNEKPVLKVSPDTIAT